MIAKNGILYPWIFRIPNSKPIIIPYIYGNRSSISYSAYLSLNGSNDPNSLNNYFIDKVLVSAFIYKFLRNFYSFCFNSGKALNKSTSSFMSAMSKIGSSLLLLIATITLDSLIPATCWIAPDIPIAK